MLEYWKGGKVAYFARFRQYSSIQSFQYSNSPLVDAFVASIETRKLFVDRPKVTVALRRLSELPHHVVPPLRELPHHVVPPPLGLQGQLDDLPHGAAATGRLRHVVGRVA